jgi:type II secretion system protein F
MQFSYKARNNASAIVSGVIEAENESGVIKKLRQQGLFPVSIEVSHKKNSPQARGRVSISETASFTRQLANLVRSGFNLSAALDTVIAQTSNTRLVRIIEDLRDRIRKGEEFSRALSAYPDTFSSFYISMVKIGEASGKLDLTLERLADFTEKSNELTAQVRSALTYPFFLMCVGILTIFALIAFYVPKLVVIFADFGQELPLPTIILMRVGSFLNAFWWAVALAVVLAAALAQTYCKAGKNREAVDRIFLRIPFLGPILQRVEISRFSYSLAVLLQNGVPILEALGVVVHSVNNRYIRGKIVLFQDQIRKGKSLSACLKSDPIFPILLVNMVGVGEESGELSDMLFRISQTFEGEISRSVKSFVSLIEPVLILCIGGVVVFMVFSILLPIFQLDFFSK